MCGRLACTLCPEGLSKACSYPVKSTNETSSKYDYVEPTFIDSGVYQYVPLYNLPPSSVVPTLVHKSHLQERKFSSCSEYAIIPMRWGLLPRWDPEATGLHTHNARIESAMQSKLFKPELMKNRRCVILCDGYFEWQTTNRDKQPYYLYQERLAADADSSECGKDWLGKPLLKLAGIFSSLVDSDGTAKYSCAVITKEADKSLSWLHHRMPIVLKTYEDVETWINNEKLNSSDSLDYLIKYGEVTSKEDKKPTYILKHHAVDKQYINKSSCRSEMCIAPLRGVKRQNTLDSWFCKKPNPESSSK